MAEKREKLKDQNDEDVKKVVDQVVKLKIEFFSLICIKMLRYDLSANVEVIIAGGIKFYSIIYATDNIYLEYIFSEDDDFIEDITYNDCKLNIKNDKIISLKGDNFEIGFNSNGKKCFQKCERKLYLGKSSRLL